MDAHEEFERNGFVLRKGLLPAALVERLVDIGTRVHQQWMTEHGEEARRLDLVNSTELTARRYFQPPFEGQRLMLFNALADDAVAGLISHTFGDGLCFHGTQIFFNPVRGERRPYWHRDIQYIRRDEQEQARLLLEFCNLHIRLPLRPEKNFLLVPGTHVRWDTDLERNVRLELSGHRSSEDLPSGRAIDLMPGDALIFSAHMLHRGTYDGNESRLSFDFMLGKVHPQFPVTPDSEQLPTREELAMLRNPQWYRSALDLISHASAG
jgi:Phytanoyl-CoA dioxygenase (PhyH)